MKVPNGATHREVGTNNYYHVTSVGTYRYDAQNGWMVCHTLNVSNLGGVGLGETLTLQERLTAILGVETDEDIVTHVKALHDAAQEQETQLSELYDIATLLCEANVLTEGSVIDAVKYLLEPKTSYWDGVEPLRVCHITEQGIIRYYAPDRCVINNLQNETVLFNTNELTPHPFATHTRHWAEPKTTYWDGVEPLRVGHIVKAGVVEWANGEVAVVRRSDEEVISSFITNLTPHPLATLSDSERELVNNLIEAGVVCLPS